MVMFKGDNNNKIEIRSNIFIVILMFVLYDIEVQNKLILKNNVDYFFY